MVVLSVSRKPTKNLRRFSVRPHSLALLVSALCAIFCTSCISGAAFSTGYLAYDRVTTGKSLNMLLTDYNHARRTFLTTVLTDWESRTEKELITTWGSPSYSQQFDDGDKFLFYEQKQLSSVTTGGNVHTYGSQYMSNSKSGTYSTGSFSSTAYKDDEVTTFLEAKGSVRITIQKNAGIKWEYSGTLNQLEEIIKPHPDFVGSDAYKTAYNARADAYTKYTTRKDVLHWLPYLWGGAVLEGCLIGLVVAARSSD